RYLHSFPTRRSSDLPYLVCRTSQGLFQNRHTQLIKTVTDCSCRFWHQGMTGHTRYGIHFKQPEVALFILHGINPPPTAGTDCLRSEEHTSELQSREN